MIGGGIGCLLKTNILLLIKLPRLILVKRSRLKGRTSRRGFRAQTIAVFLELRLDKVKEVIHWDMFEVRHPIVKTNKPLENLLIGVLLPLGIGILTLLY